MKIIVIVAAALAALAVLLGVHAVLAIAWDVVIGAVSAGCGMVAHRVLKDGLWLWAREVRTS